MIFSIALASAAIFPIALGSPLQTRDFGHPACPLDKAHLAFTKESNLTVPHGLDLKYLAVGRGTQNYTCSPATSTYTNNQAQAVLFDASCLADLPLQLALAPLYALAGPDPVHPNLNVVNSSVAQNKQLVISNIAGLIPKRPPPKEIGQHFFRPPLPGAAAASPEFTFVSSTGDPNQFTVDAKVHNIPDPLNPTFDVDWLDLSSVGGQAGGQAAKKVFRVNTAGGQPPKTCNARDPNQATLLVQYAAIYYFFA
jgi:hypothetical protein